MFVFLFRLQDVTDGMLQVQLLVPSLNADAAITATMSNTDRLTLEIKSDVKLPETSSIQAVVFHYGKFINKILEWTIISGICPNTV